MFFQVFLLKSFFWASLSKQFNFLNPLRFQVSSLVIFCSLQVNDINIPSKERRFVIKFENGMWTR